VGELVGVRLEEVLGLVGLVGVLGLFGLGLFGLLGLGAVGLCVGSALVRGVGDVASCSARGDGTHVRRGAGRRGAHHELRHGESDIEIEAGGFDDVLLVFGVDVGAGAEARVVQDQRVGAAVVQERERLHAVWEVRVEGEQPEAVIVEDALPPRDGVRVPLADDCRGELCELEFHREAEERAEQRGACGALLEEAAEGTAQRLRSRRKWQKLLRRDGAAASLERRGLRGCICALPKGELEGDAHRTVVCELKEVLGSGEDGDGAEAAVVEEERDVTLGNGDEGPEVGGEDGGERVRPPGEVGYDARPGLEGLVQSAVDGECTVVLAAEAQVVREPRERRDDLLAELERLLLLHWHCKKHKRQQLRRSERGK
jgi:hypothetical protein